MKKSFLARIAPVMIAAIAAIFGFMMSGCEQTDDIIQSVQNATPAASDFTITGLTATADGSPKSVSVKPKTGKSQGAITVYYEGTNGSVYSRNTAPPSAAGKYAVTFDVAEAEGFNAANSLKAGTLTINKQTAGNIENEDGDYTDDDDNEEPSGKPSEKPSEKPAEEVTKETDNEENEETTEEIIETSLLIDFEDKAWGGSGANSFNNRKITFKEYDWSISGVTTMIKSNDHYIGSRGVRFRGSENDGDGNNINRLELVSFLSNGIESISFNYASYGSHEGGALILYYQKINEEWEKAGEISNIPSWTNGGSQMLNAIFEINVTGNVRFKIVKVNVKKNTASVNVDNILITYLQ